MTEKETKTYEIPLWKDGEFVQGHSSILSVIQAEKASGLSFGKLANFAAGTQEAIRSVFFRDHAFYDKLIQGSKSLESIVLGKAGEDVSRCFEDEKTGKTKIVLDPQNLLKIFQRDPKLTAQDKKYVLYYFLAYELEHAYQKKKAISFKKKITNKNALDVHIVQEVDAVSMGLLRAYDAGISPKVISFLEKNYFKNLSGLDRALTDVGRGVAKIKKLMMKTLHTFEKNEILDKGLSLDKYGPEASQISSYPEVFEDVKASGKPLARLSWLQKLRKLRGGR